MSASTQCGSSAALAVMSLAVVLVAAGACSAQPAAGYEDTFDLPDWTSPAEWEWTGYSEEGGSFLVYEGAFTHIEGGPVYYYRPYFRGHRNLPGYYHLVIKDSDWVFAWRITETDPTAGRCLWLSHDQLLGSWAYTFAECSWENLDPAQYPSGAYMWHNATFLRVAQSPTPGPLAGWHIVEIHETGPSALNVEISVDREQIFDETYELIPEGLQGLGCLAAGDMTPAFDSIWAQWPDPVESESWGRIKGLYR
jgi:hypothetical protein